MTGISCGSLAHFLSLSSRTATSAKDPISEWKTCSEECLRLYEIFNCNDPSVFRNKDVGRPWSMKMNSLTICSSVRRTLFPRALISHVCRRSTSSNFSVTFQNCASVIDLISFSSPLAVKRCSRKLPEVSSVSDSPRYSEEEDETWESE